MHESVKRGRRALLKGSAIVAGSGVAAAMMPLEPARAQKTPKSGVHYQGKPKNGQMCDDYKFFGASHSCHVVAGTISPQGRCVLFTKK